MEQSRARKGAERVRQVAFDAAAQRFARSRGGAGNPTLRSSVATGLKVRLACQIAMPLAMSIRLMIGPEASTGRLGIAQQILAPGQFQFDPVVALIGELQTKPAGIGRDGKNHFEASRASNRAGGAVHARVHRGRECRPCKPSCRHHHPARATPPASRSIAPCRE